MQQAEWLALSALFHAKDMRTISFFLLSLLLPCHFFQLSFSQRYNALFNFGDSLSDTGNINLAKLPYGMTYFSHPTGRCSDGRLVIDFIAQGLGLPLLPPCTASNESFHQGANFAHIAATVRPFDYYHQKGLGKAIFVNASFPYQIDLFEEKLPSICGGLQECKDFLSKSLVIVGEFGGNDYSTAIFSNWEVEEARTLAPDVTQGLADGLERLFGLGVVDVVVPGVLPVGCFPLFLSFYLHKPEQYGSRTGCLKHFNLLSWYHNALLRRQLDRLRLKYPAVSIRYADYYAQVVDFASNPLKYGFTVGALRTCCGAPGLGNYNYNSTVKCDMEGHTVCEDPSTHVSWDGIHMTEAANRFVADGWLHGPYVNPPILRSSDT